MIEPETEESTASSSDENSKIIKLITCPHQGTRKGVFSYYSSAEKMNIAYQLQKP